jgi:NADH-ubiquinone oxidoreductase chain 4
MPVFMVHLLLAYVEAYVSGSMILAGVLLKLGGYGLLRVFPVLFKFGFKFSIVWVALSSVWWSFY